MGGLLFNTQRLPLVEFNKYRKDVETILELYNIDYKIPLYYRDKKDFGDLDILIKTSTPTSLLLNIFKDCECSYDKPETIISFNYKNFQIDFIKIKPEDIDIAFHYYSYNDLGNLIGQLAKMNYLKFGWDGLKYNHYVRGQKLGVIYISKNIDKILSFLDLSPSKFHNGFDTIQEVFDYVCKSIYFNPYVSDLEPYGYNDAGVALYYINKINRERNSKRKTYMEWLDYIKKYKNGKENYKFRSDFNIEDAYDRIDEFFPEVYFKERLEHIQRIEDNRIKTGKKFNGNIIIELLPDLQKEDRQFFIDSFKEHIIKKYVDFDEFIVVSSSELIKREILDFFTTFKRKYNG